MAKKNKKNNNNKNNNNNEVLKQRIHEFKSKIARSQVWLLKRQSARERNESTIRNLNPPMKCQHLNHNESNVTPSRAERASE